jgi:hypothetical protein
MEKAMKAIIAMTVVLTAMYGAIVASANARQLKSSDADYNALVRVANAWKSALAKRDATALTNMTWPEYQPATRRALRNPKSTLYRMLFGGQRPLNRRIAETPESRTYIFEQIDDYPAVKHYAICYALTPTADSKWPDEFSALLKLRNAERFCAYSEKSQDGTFVSYTFADNPND